MSVPKLHTPDDIAEMLQLSIHTIYAATSRKNRKNGRRFWGCGAYPKC